MGLMPPSPDEIAAASKPRDTGYTLIPVERHQRGRLRPVAGQDGGGRSTRTRAQPSSWRGESPRPCRAGGQQVQGRGRKCPEPRARRLPRRRRWAPSQVDTPD